MSHIDSRRQIPRRVPWTKPQSAPAYERDKGRRPSPQGSRPRVAIVGGGPGGLITAYCLEKRLGQGACDITIFEAGDRVGGKIRDLSFDGLGIEVEGGAAEIYDYSGTGPDPFRQLVEQLGLSTLGMAGDAIIRGDDILRDDDDILRIYGEATRASLDAFHEKCKGLCSPAQFYAGDWLRDARHPWAHKTFREVLDEELRDPVARHIVEFSTHSDLATEPHLTSGAYGLSNVLMVDPDYLGLYCIRGGNERLIEALKARISAKILLRRRVAYVGKNQAGGYRLTSRTLGLSENHDFDMVVLALPNYWLPALEYGRAELAKTMRKHVADFDRPAHYLRVTAVFQKPFWRHCVPGSFFMTDAFGGTCVYDESARRDCRDYGVLGWLLAGNAALTLASQDDGDSIRMVLDSLPAPLAHGRELFVEGRVTRWSGAVNALPGGLPGCATSDAHVPEPVNHPGLFLVGDYFADSTLNAVYDAADATAEMIAHRLANQTRAAIPASSRSDVSGRTDLAPHVSLGRSFLEVPHETTREEQDHAPSRVREGSPRPR